MGFFVSNIYYLIITVLRERIKLISDELINWIYNEVINTSTKIVYVKELDCSFSVHNIRVLTHHITNEQEIKDFIRKMLLFLERQKYA